MSSFQQWELNNREIETVNNIFSSVNLIDDIMQPVSERKNFKYNDSIITIPRFFYRFIGNSKDNEQLYFDNILEYNNKLSKLNNLYLFLPNGFNVHYSDDFRKKFNECWIRISALIDLEANTVVEIFDKFNLFINFPLKELNNQIRSNFASLIDYYFEINNQQIQEQEFKDILFYNLFWINEYFNNLFMDFDYPLINPKMLYYGDITKEGIFFLVYLSSLGVDILYFNPLNTCEFNSIDRNNIFSNEILYDKRMSIQKLPITNTRTNTTVYDKSLDLDAMLHSEDSGFYKPFQFENYKLVPNTVKIHLAELVNLLKQDALYRENFRVENGSVYISNIFVKVNGVFEKISKYWNFVNEIRTLKNTVFIKELEQLFSKDFYSILGSIDLEKHFIIKNENEIIINKDVLLSSNQWRYGHLRESIQNLIFDKMIYFLNNNQHKDIDEINNAILYITLFMSDLILNELQKFDYTKSIPKIMIYCDSNKEYDIEHGLILSFLNLLGFDIVIFNPSGFNNIEKFIPKTTFDTIMLEKLETNLKYKGSDKKIFGSIMNIFSE